MYEGNPFHTSKTKIFLAILLRQPVLVHKLESISTVVLCKRVFKNQKVEKKTRKRAILATPKLGSVSQCSQKDFQKPVKYSETKVGNVRNICHCIYLWSLFQGVKVKFFSKRTEKLKKFEVWRQLLKLCKTFKTP